MIAHINMGNNAAERGKKIRSLIRKRQISLAGYKKAKIYGLLTCASGKRIKEENRVFFRDEKEAVDSGYRPCGHCLPEKYRKWKAHARLIQESNGLNKLGDNVLKIKSSR